MTRSCPRSWEVEALRDRRMTGDARASTERHIEGCSICAAEQRAFDKLSLALREASADNDEVGLRRLRHRVLARAHAGSEGVERPSRGRARWLLPTLGLVMSGALATTWIVLRHAPKASDPVAEVDAPTEVDASPDAIWSRSSIVEKSLETERIRIERGVVRLHNPRPPGRKPLVVSVPDGEIEDLGTVFRVTVAAGRTNEIAVIEGRVRFNRVSDVPVIIVAGEQWHPTTPAEIEAPSSSPSAIQSPVVASLPSSTARPVRAAAASSSQPPIDVTATADAARQQEDSAYLHILALAREGRDDEARLAAIDYLNRFPNGFRRVEVGRFAKRTP